MTNVSDVLCQGDLERKSHLFWRADLGRKPHSTLVITELIAGESRITRTRWAFPVADTWSGCFSPECKGVMPTSTSLPILTSSSFCSRLRLHDGKLVKDRRYHLRTYPNCFVAKELTDWLINHKEAPDRETGIRLMQKLMDHYIIHHGLWAPKFWYYWRILFWNASWSSKWWQEWALSQ